MRNSCGERSECAMPRPAVIQLTSPGEMSCTLPSVSRWRMVPAHRKVTVARPMCVCGHTSKLSPGCAVIGPKWSKKTKGPTAWRCADGSERRRLPHYPPNWLRLTNLDLEGLLARAESVRRKRPGSNDSETVIS